MDEFAPPVTLRFDRERVPTPGAVRLVFGDSTPVRPGVHLLFSRPPVSTPGPVRLVFGDDGTDPPAPTIPDATLHGAGQITGLRLRVAVRAGVRVHAAGRITGLRLRIGARYDVNVQRPTVGQIASRWQDAAPAFISTRDNWQQTATMPIAVRQGWQDADALAVATVAAWQSAQQQHRAVVAHYEQARRLPTAALLASYQQALSLRHDTRAAFEEALRLPTAPTRVAFEAGLQLRAGGMQRFEVAAPAWHRVRSGMGIAVGMAQRFGGRFEQAMPPPPGQWQRPLPPQPEPCYVPSLPARLLFATEHDASLPARLVFICERAQPPDPQPGATVVVPIRRVYVTINNLALLRADTGQPLAAYALSMSLDVDSWTWQWSATLHPSALPLIIPGADGDPVNVVASVNGVQYRLAVESYSRQRKFGEERIAVSGRGRAALLDAPYAPTLNSGSAVERTARQLAEDALTINGVGIGWDVDWGISDWSVPGDTWTHQGSYISAILDIASAAGGYVQPHNTDPVLRILPRYPAPPWNWGALTPDFELPSAVVTVEGIEWQRKAPYDRVYVSGTTSSGVIGQITRGGTAGGAVAPMVTHPLITHATAARQRGIAELGDTGNQAQINLTLPVLSETGLIKPGALVRYVDGGDTHLGLVRSTSLNWSRPTLRQTLSVETHPV